MRLADVLADAPFPLFAVARERWSGTALVGHVERMTIPRPALRSVKIVYLDGAEPPLHGAVVSVVDPGVAPRHDDSLDEHLADAVARFDAAFVQKRVRARRAAFPLGEFDATGVVLELATGSTGARQMQHRVLPLQVIRFAAIGGRATADVAVACWDLDARDFAAGLEPVGVEFARAFDAAGEPRYPPPEWGPVEEDQDA